jgi:hypothetical protein
MDVEPDRAPLDLDGHHGAERRAPLLRLPPIRFLSLLAVGIDRLPEMTCTAQQRDKDNRKLQIGTGARCIVGQDTETASVAVHFRPNRDLHREIRDARA